MATECQLPFSDEDSKMLDEARERGVVIPEMFQSVPPEVEKILQEKATEIAKLETPREERAMRLINSGIESDEKISPQEGKKEVSTYKAFGVCPVKVENFSGSWLGSNEKIIEKLEKLPQIGHLAFEGVKYTTETELTKDAERGIGFIAGEATPDKSGRVSLKINEHHPDFFEDMEDVKDPEIREQKMKEKEEQTLVHEYAEGVWRELTTLEERSQWRHLYVRSTEFVTDSAKQSTKEDFCECSAMYFTKPDKLMEKDEAKYNLLKEFYDNLEKESEWLAEQLEKGE